MDMNVAVILTLIVAFLEFNSVVCQDETLSVLRGQKAELKCPIDETTCGELHSLKWFKRNERIAVVSGDGEVANVEGGYIGRLSIDHSPTVSRLVFNAVEISDEDTYLCETTFLEPSESCENTGAFSVLLNIYAIPSIITLHDAAGNTINNSSHVGPMREGQQLNVICEVLGARPSPTVSWYRSGRKVASNVNTEDHSGLFSVKASLAIALSRQELGSTYTCNVDMPELELSVNNQFHIDLQVKPMKINVSGVKHHTVQGTKVLLQCQVSGARPAANVTWSNSTTKVPEDSESTTISTKTYLQNDGTFETISQMIFTATRFENGAKMICEGDNIVMRDESERPLHDSLTLEVLYPPVVSVKPENITVNETQDFLVFCEYDSNPASLEKVKWLKNNQEILLNNPRFEGGNPEQTALLVKNATRHDIGAYTCRLSNAIGTETSDNEVFVDVFYIPRVEMTMDPDAPVIENDQSNITLYCNIVEGNPYSLTKVRWFLDGQLLKELPDCDPMNDFDSEDNLCEIDPSKMLLQNVGREFLGNYSCEGYNSAGWGPRSDEKELIVYYEPGNATMTHTPLIAIKKKSVTFNCAIEEGGNPFATKFHWLRGGRPIIDVVTPQYIIDSVGLDSKTNFSCYAYNEGGHGVHALIDLEVYAPPAFIQKMPPYTGALYSDTEITLMCPIECVPLCNISWFKDGVGIDENDQRYFITDKIIPEQPSTGDFESILSTLHFNMSAWPGGKLDIISDNSNYSCVSSNNAAGPGVRSTTYFGVEYPPENTTITTKLLQVEEGKTPPPVFCTSNAYPEPSYKWMRYNDEISKGNTLIINVAMERSDAGPYTCVAFNKHGTHTSDVIIDINYKPECTIERKEIDDEDVLICTATGSPKDVDFEWSIKNENETLHGVKPKSNPYTSHLILDRDVAVMRTYICVANNSVGAGPRCEYSVDGYVSWWMKKDTLTPYILIGALVALILAVIIVCIIIICICRRRRRQDKFAGDQTGIGGPQGEPGEYENLPFHGMQNAPKKPLADIADDIVYADVDFNSNYGPINYKAASVYNLVKFKKPPTAGATNKVAPIDEQVIANTNP